uniref:cerebellin-1-like isoform X1 n=1 Tax=Scatophagus argus TaxID=75038 RepID=UPI001ED7E99F|nr:cerebellin-1-like isoform X1 [Scatophagus argus]
MNFAVLSFAVLFCGSTLAHDGGNITERERSTEALSCFPVHDLLIQFGALTEKVKAMETRMQESEKQILELTKKGAVKYKNCIEEFIEHFDHFDQNVLFYTEKPEVIFSAVAGRGNTDFGPFNTDITLIFRRVITNVGNAYSQSTGVFVAPVAGVYYFTIFFHAGGEHAGMLLLFKNQELMVMTHDHKTKHDNGGNDPADNGGNAVFLQLQRGDQVYVRMPANSYVWGSDFHTTFSGFLVTEM